MVVIVLTDVAGSTAQTRARGWAVVKEIRARVKALEAAFRATGVRVHFASEGGDGRIYVAEESAPLIRAALAEQGRWSATREGLPARIVFAVGQVAWTGEPWTEGVTVLGDSVNLAGRLKAACPAGGVALSSITYELLSGYPDLRQRFRRVEVPIEDFGTQRVWVWGDDDATRGGGDEPMPEQHRNGHNGRLTFLGAVLVALVVIFGAIAGSPWVTRTEMVEIKDSLRRDFNNIDRRLQQIETALEQLRNSQSRHGPR